jgi:hypothetical protein
VAKDVMQDVIAAFEEATASARAERTKLAAEIAELQAKRAEEQRWLEDFRHTSVLEFIKRCIDAGIDKLTIDELRAKVAAIVNTG